MQYRRFLPYKAYWIYFSFMFSNVSPRLFMRKVDFDFVSNFAKDILKENGGGTALIFDAETGAELAMIDY